MIVKIHKIHWPKRYNSYGKDIDIEITDTDCYVTKSSHPCANWAVKKKEAWHRVSSWFERKGATVTLGKPKEVENKQPKKNKR